MVVRVRVSDYGDDDKGDGIASAVDEDASRAASSSLKVNSPHLVSANPPCNDI